MTSNTKWKLQAISVSVGSMLAVLLFIALFSNIDIGWYLIPPWDDPGDGRTLASMTHRMLDPNTNMPIIVASHKSDLYAIIYTLVMGGPLVLAAILLLTNSNKIFSVGAKK